MEKKINEDVLKDIIAINPKKKSSSRIMVIPNNQDHLLDLEKIKEIARQRKQNKKSSSSGNATNGSHEVADEFEQNESKEDKKIEYEEEDKKIIINNEDKNNKALQNEEKNEVKTNLKLERKNETFNEICSEFFPIQTMNQKASNNKKMKQIRAQTILGGTTSEEFKSRMERATKKMDEANDYFAKGEKIKALKCSIEVITN